MEENTQNINIKDAASMLQMDAMTSFSEVVSDRKNTVPDFSSLSREGIEDMEEFNNFQPSAAVDKAVIDTNQTAQKIKIDQMSAVGQKPSELGNDIKFREQELFDTTTQGFPTEMDTEELPPDIGGVTPRASRGVSKSRGGVDLRTTGNPYGYA
tara:strand:- start:10 stop:471 length:462 start_codon:yes stop_codon:yes gene_type:complete